MENKPKVSIIIPVYKVEKYLRRSMDSLINQTLDEVEIICINDGSPDNCLSILKEYKEIYNNKNIIIIDKKNEGVWKGRMDGIKAANGEYIAFIDSDDYITLDYAEKLYNAAKKNNSDILVSGFYRVDNDTNHIYSTEMTGYEEKLIKMDENPEDILSINTALWNKLYKSEILKEINDLEKPPIILEDMMFLLLVYLNTKTISFINDPLYYYMVRPDSTMSQIKKEQIKSTEKAMLEIKKIYENDSKGKKMIEVIDTMAFLHFGISLMFRVSSDKQNFKQVLKENRNYLNKEFPLWRKSKYLNISYSLSHKGANLKVAIVKKVYKIHMYKMFLSIYKFILKVFKIDIKW